MFKPSPSPSVTPSDQSPPTKPSPGLSWAEKSKQVDNRYMHLRNRWQLGDRPPVVKGGGRFTLEKRWMIGLHNVANAVAKDKMKEPPASQIVLEPPKWFRKTPKANEGHVVEYYKDLKWDSDSEMLAMDSGSGSDTEEEEEEEEGPDEPKEKKVSAAAYHNPHLSIILM